VLTQANLLMYVREKVSLFWVIIFPMGLMLLFGTMFGHIKINPADPDSLTVISFMVPGLIVLALMSNGLVGNAEAMAVYRERGILRRVQTTPLPVSQFLLSRILVQVPVMVVLAFVMVGVSVVVFNARFDVIGLIISIPAIIFVSLVFISIGQAIAALVRKPQTATVVASAINLPLMFLGGLWMNMDDLPEWLQGIATYLPSAVAADTVRAPMLSEFNYEFTNLPLGMSWLLLVGYFAFTVAISIRFFKWDTQPASISTTVEAVEATSSATRIVAAGRVGAQAKAAAPARGSDSLRRFGQLIQANFLMLLRARDYIFWVILFPILMMLLFGVIWGQQGNMPTGISVVSFLTPGLIVLALMSNGLPGRAEMMAIYRERGILRRVQATPLPVWQLLAADTLVQLVVLVGQIFLLLGVSILVFNASYDFGGLVLAIPAVVLGALTFMSLGTMVAALVRKVQSANVVAMAALFPLMFLGNLWMPVSQFPEVLLAVSKALPSTMTAELVRTPMLSGYQPVMPLWVCVVGIVAYLATSSAIAARFFKW
jgi:ABC-2 type transport system permease protein